MIAHPIAAAGIGVSIFIGSFSPAQTNVLSGDTVTWHNDSVRRHTVTARDGTWGSTTLFPGDGFAHAFDHPGAVAYYCTIHPFMRGEIDVYDLLLTAPTEPGAPGRPYTLSGRSALPPGTPVTIEGDEGSGFTPTATTTVAEDGGFHAAVVPSTSSSYRAVAGREASPVVRLLVLDRHVTASARQAGRRTIVRVRVDPASPHATIVLQLRLRERFGWWPVRIGRLDHHSAATFRLTLHRRVRARAVLTLADGATPLARSAVFHVGRSRPRR
jgi:hypothetical protein